MLKKYKLTWDYSTIIFNLTNRSIHRRCSVKKGVLNNFANFTGKHICRSHFLLKLQAEDFYNKKRLQHWCFPVKCVKFIRTLILKNICKRLNISIIVKLEKKNIIPKQLYGWPKASNFIKKKALKQVFSCEFYDVFKNIFFKKTTAVAPSDNKITKIRKKTEKVKA